MVSAGFSRRVALPCREAGERALQLLLADLQLASRLQALCVHACEALLAQVAASYFVPFCLTAASVAARMRVLSGAAMMAIVRAYNTAVPLFAVFPARRLDVAAAIDVPETVRVTWRHGVPSVALAPFASGAAGWKLTAERLATQYGVTQSAGIGASGMTRGAYRRAACMCTNPHLQSNWLCDTTGSDRRHHRCIATFPLRQQIGASRARKALLTPQAYKCNPRQGVLVTHLAAQHHVCGSAMQTRVCRRTDIGGGCRGGSLGRRGGHHCGHQRRGASCDGLRTSSPPCSC